MKNKNLDLILHRKRDWVVTENNSKDDTVYDVYYLAELQVSCKLLDDAKDILMIGLINA